MMNGDHRKTGNLFYKKTFKKLSVNGTQTALLLHQHEIISLGGDAGNLSSDQVDYSTGYHNQSGSTEF